MHKKYPVRLNSTERDRLESLIGAGSAPARVLPPPARILLKRVGPTLHRQCDTTSPAS